MLIEIAKAVLFGIVQGITEWLPISSTGHMILLNEFVTMNMSEKFMEMFFVVVQLGAILAVLVLFGDKLRPFSLRGGFRLKAEALALWPKIVAASIPAGVVGLLWGNELNSLFFTYPVVIVMLALFGVLFIVVENRNKGKEPVIKTTADLTYKAALWIGFFQLIAAVFPGTSRSGSTIIGALMIGVSRVAAAEFTFLLAVPIMIGASAVKLLDFGLHFTATLCRIRAGHPLPHVLHQDQRLQGLRLVPDYPGRRRFLIFLYTPVTIPGSCKHFRRGPVLFVKKIDSSIQVSAHLSGQTFYVSENILNIETKGEGHVKFIGKLRIFSSFFNKLPCIFLRFGIQ